MMRFLLLATTALALAFPLRSSVTAQTPDGPYWTTMTVPTNFLSVQALGSIVHMRTATDAWFYSGITRNWVTIPASSTATVNLCNKYAVVRDGTTITAFSARTGQAHAITVAATAVYSSAPTSSSWVCVVRDGTTLYGFGAFAGFWDQITIQQATVSVAAGPYTMVVYDGTFAHTIGAYEGTFQSVPVGPGAQISAGGMSSVAYNATNVWCYSAHWNIWMPQAFASVGVPTNRDGFTTFQNATTVLAFSALTNTYSTCSPTNLPVALGSNRNTAEINDGTTTWCYAAGTNTWTPVVTATVPIVSNFPEFNLIDDGTGLIAFSGITGTVTPKLAGQYFTYTNDDVCIAQGTNTFMGYSPFTATWVQASATTALQVATVRNAGILVTSTGYEAFASRDGTWHPITTTVTQNFQSISSGAVFCAIDGLNLSIFDSRFSRWVTTTTTDPVVQTTIWRQVLITNDATNLYGYSLMNNAWDRIALDGAVVQQATNSSIAFARTATTIFIFDGHGSLSTLGRFPEFTRMQPKGTDFTMIQVGPPGSIVTAGVSLLPTMQNFGPFGNLFIDPAALVIIQPLGVIPPSGILDLTAPTPNDPAWNGLQLWIQNVIQTPTGGVYFSNAIAPMFI